METVDLGNGVVVSGIGDAQVVPAGGAQRRSPGRVAPQDDPVDAALDVPEFDVVADVVVMPTPAPAPAPALGTSASARRQRADRVAAAPVDPRIAVAVAPDQDAVVLLERGGVYRWVFPETPAGGATRRGRQDAGRGAETLLFVLDPAAADGGAVRSTRRGIVDAVVDRLIEPVRVRVVRFLATATIDEAVRRIEGDLVEGLVDMTGPASSWQVAAGSPPPDLSKARNVLLMIHGTFSTTRSCYAALEATDAGRDFLASVRGQYDVVIGFDHRTLAATPRENAEAILRALDDLPAGATIDAVAHSRGGLVLRSLAGLPGTRQWRFDKAIFVGCTNAGTHLAEPANWRTLVDLYTNIIVAGARVIDAATGAVAGGWATLAIRTIARFVQALPDLAIGEGKVPGLAAMQPGSNIVKALAAASPRVPAMRLHVVRSDFEPRIDRGKAISGELVEFLVDRVVDRLFDTANDLVVDTASMTDFGPAVAAPRDDALLTIAASEAIYHTIYFAAPVVATRLAQWLAGGRIVSAQPDPPSRRRGRQDGVVKSATIADGVMGDAPADTLTDAEPAPVPARRRGRSAASPPPPPPPQPAPKLALPAAIPASCYFAAEMDPAPTLGVPAPLFISISRERIVTAAHAAAASTASPAPVDAALPITITLVAIENCRIVGNATIDIPVPATSDTLRFLVEGFAPGLARIQIEASQGSQPLVSLQIEPVFVAADRERLSVSARAVPDVSPSANGAVLRIYELRQQDGSLLLRYDMSGKGLTATHDVTLPASFRMDAFVGDFLARLDGAYDKTETEYGMFLKRIRDFAIDATNQLMPEAIRRTLWANHGRIAAIHVIADSPYVPWELLYIDDPAGGVGDGRGFLCEWGLIRWMYNARWPGETLPLRGDRVRYVVPDYLNRSDQLPQADRERAMLLDRFPGAQAVAASSDAVTAYVYDHAAECDLLHFACHGEAKQAAVLNSDLVLAGAWNDNGSVAEDLLGSSAVKRAARFDAADASGFVFINACQTGRPGEGIAGVTGFADAFLRPVSGRGAAGFVGALWSVDDTLALTFASTFYDRLHAGDTLVAAVGAARKACMSQRDFTWLAYSVYGNPFARLSP